MYIPALARPASLFTCWFERDFQRRNRYKYKAIMLFLRHSGRRKGDAAHGLCISGCLKRYGAAALSLFLFNK
jgi:hypothetical protein